MRKCHVTDLNACRGEFLDWSDAKRNRFYGKLIRIMRDNLTVFVGRVVRTVDFDEVGADYPDVKFTAYQFLLEQTLLLIGHWAMTKRYVKEMGIFIAKPQQESTRITSTRLFESWIRVPELRTFTKITDFDITRRVDEPPFQVADFACYELFRYHQAGGWANPSVRIRTLKCLMTSA